MGKEVVQPSDQKEKEGENLLNYEVTTNGSNLSLG